MEYEVLGQVVVTALSPGVLCRVLSEFWLEDGPSLRPVAAS